MKKLIVVASCLSVFLVSAVPSAQAHKIFKTALVKHLKINQSSVDSQDSVDSVDKGRREH